MSEKVGTLNRESVSCSYAANDIWGWTDPQTGDEYAIICLSCGTSFVRITDPENPVVVAYLPTEYVLNAKESCLLQTAPDDVFSALVAFSGNTTVMFAVHSKSQPRNKPEIGCLGDFAGRSAARGAT